MMMNTIWNSLNSKDLSKGFKKPRETEHLWFPLLSQQEKKCPTTTKCWQMKWEKQNKSRTEWIDFQCWMPLLPPRKYWETLKLQLTTDFVFSVVKSKCNKQRQRKKLKLFLNPSSQLKQRFIIAEINLIRQFSKDLLNLMIPMVLPSLMVMVFS